MEPGIVCVIKHECEILYLLESFNKLSKNLPYSFDKIEHNLLTADPVFPLVALFACVAFSTDESYGVDENTICHTRDDHLQPFR